MKLKLLFLFLAVFLLNVTPAYAASISGAYEYLPKEQGDPTKGVIEIKKRSDGNFDVMVSNFADQPGFFTEISGIGKLKGNVLQMDLKLKDSKSNKDVVVPFKVTFQTKNNRVLATVDELYKLGGPFSYNDAYNEGISGGPGIYGTFIKK